MSLCLFVAQDSDSAQFSPECHCRKLLRFDIKLCEEDGYNHERKKETAAGNEVAIQPTRGRGGRKMKENKRGDNDEGGEEDEEGGGGGEE